MGRKKQIIVLDSGINVCPAAMEKQLVDNVPFIDECYIYSPDNAMLVCEFYSQSNPSDKTALIDYNNSLDCKITKFICKKEPLPKTNKLEIMRTK